MLIRLHGFESPLWCGSYWAYSYYEVFLFCCTWFLYIPYPAVTFTVTNTRDEDGTWLYPSNVVQADNIAIMNKVADITDGPETAEDKAKAIHDWIVLNGTV